MDWVVILAGGSGTRFWPLSSPRHPKQLLPLAGPTPSAVAAVAAVEPLVTRRRILMVTGPDLAEPLRQATGLPADQVLVEPVAASTAPALAWGTTTALARDPSATILSMHADWHLGDPDGFRRTADAALFAARQHDALITVGITPTRTETGYGYIVPGEPVDGAVRQVTRFREKPDRATAEALIASGALWNSGLFAWTASRFLAEVRQHTPELAGSLVFLAEGDVSRFFESVTPVSVDIGLLERSNRVLTIAGDFGWDDVGAWDALARLKPADRDGNVLQGPVYTHESGGCIAWSDGTPIVLSGVRDLIVVHANGRVLVLDRSRGPDLKRTLDVLPPEVRDLP
ncbi:MAG TPA: sugar phosphate nucleotidyltransferase [Gemmatimonadales bacterium]